MQSSQAAAAAVRVLSLLTNSSSGDGTFAGILYRRINHAPVQYIYCAFYHENELNLMLNDENNNRSSFLVFSKKVENNI